MKIVITYKEKNHQGIIEEIVSHAVDEDTLEDFTLPQVPIQWIRSSVFWDIQIEQWVLKEDKI